MNHRALRILEGRGALAAPMTPVGPALDDASINRIEEWVVSTLDDRTRNAGEADWMASLDGLTLTKRTPQARNPVKSSTAEPAGWARFRLSKRRGVAIVSLTDQALVKEEDLIELTGDVRALVEAGHRRIVLDFFAVERLSSWAASAIDQAVREWVSTEGTAVKFSGLKPDVAMMFAMTGLDPRVAIYPDTASAVAAVWPELPDLRPLPVSILTALMRAEEIRSTSAPAFRSSRSGRLDEDQTAMNAARLIVQDGRSAGKSVAIQGAKFVIGRGPDCDLRVRSATVSRSHAEIARRGGKLYLRDLASTNGTILNGRTLRDREAEVRDGDRIRIGKLSFRLSTRRAAETVIVREDSIAEFFRSDDRGLSTSVGNHDVTEEFFDIGDLGEDLGLKYEVIEGVLVVTPMTAELDEQADVDAFRDSLLAIGAKNAPNRVVINLTNVSHLSGRAIGVLVAHHLRLDRSGGALRVCLANPRVAVLLEQIKLGMIVDYHPTVEDAVIAAWPEPVGSPGQG